MNVYAQPTLFPISIYPILPSSSFFPPPLPFTPPPSVGTPEHAIVLPPFRVDLSTSMYQSGPQTSQETCFHVILNPIKVSFKINHHKHITYLGVNKTHSYLLSLVLILQLRMRLNKKDQTN